ncbi:thiosulfate/3-mercaptopyruvate sulfurtransferase [Mesobacillus persicus]|uniref:Thiosulfate/3-mercaptopyruvate sulfurtransferase n=1 Tax=Mesobacillus persicus TaxID=930146 RepID=A0A1H8AI14_9BACI|nr:sulfurtransferase [Mesobacillus persicus]SEM70442.1 thiosulfate/3-mercaptopyruvate sulfurtransferase [Mesobacillus persicus]
MSNNPYIVDTNWLSERLDDPKLRLLDATTFLKIPDKEGDVGVWSGRDAYNEGHIPGAVFADLLKDLSDPNGKLPFTVPPREQFVRVMEELGVGEGTYVVIYDQGAMVGSPVVAAQWASRLAWQLRYEGFDDISVLEGGFQKWKDEGRSVSTEAGHYPRAHFTGERRPNLLATKEDVKKAMNDENVVLINSLSPADFKGETNTYPRKGHIPNSVNVFFGNHADEKTREVFDDSRLRESFEKVGALDPNKKVITYCGGGIAATWNALILNKLGQKNVAVYDGSMNEWASDPDCPLITGS